MRKRPPPPLTTLRTEFQILCEEHGGPLKLWEVCQSSLELACGQFYFAQSWEAYQEWEPDQIKAKRLWPWVALAALAYQVQRDVKEHYTFDEPTPTAIKKLLTSIAKDSRSLCDKIARLEELSNRLSVVR